MSMPRVWWSLPVVCGALLAAQPAAAQPPPGPAPAGTSGTAGIPGNAGNAGSDSGNSGANPAPPTEAARREAEARFSEGKDLYAAGKIDEARLKFAEAYVVLRRVNILWNLAVSELYSKHPLDAVRHFREFCRAPGAEPNDITRAKGEFIPQLEKQTSRIQVEAPDGTQVTVDGELMGGAAPFHEVIDVAPGPHKVQAKTAGGPEPTVIEVNCPTGEVVIAKVVVPEGAILSNGVRVGPNGAVEGGGHEGWDDDRQRGPSSGKIATTAVLGGLGVVGLGVGAVFALKSQSDASDAKSQHSQAAVNSGETASSTAKVLYVGGGVLVAAAIVTWLVWPDRRHEREEQRGAAALRIVPTLGAGGGGVLATGSF